MSNETALKNDLHVGIMSTVGNTPLVQLKHILGDVPFRLFAKLEMFNPGGSTKDRAALNIIKNAMEEGLINANTTIIESSSGNMGIGLAQVCACFGLKFICVVDLKTTSQNINILKTYGATIEVVTEPARDTGDFLQARLQHVQTLLRSIPNSFWTNQYANRSNPLAHHQTMHEIATRLDNRVDYLICATSTCGTLRGCAEYIRQHNLKTHLIAVDAKGSAIFRNTPAKRLIPGHGAALRPDLYQPFIAEQTLFVSDQDCVVGCRRLLKREVILAGGSAGGVIIALDRFKEHISPDSNCVVLLCDRGERYLDTIYNDDWVKEHLGDLSPFV